MVIVIGSRVVGFWLAVCLDTRGLGRRRPERWGALGEGYRFRVCQSDR
jgi:hypothetical protein